MTSLPFVWAFWAGRPGAVEPAHLEALRAARIAGEAALDEIAAAHGPEDEDEAAVARTYLDANVQFALNGECLAGLKRFFASALDLGIVQQAASVRFYES